MGPAVGLYAVNPRGDSPSSATTIRERYKSHRRTLLILGSEQSRPNVGRGNSLSASMALSASRTVIDGDQKAFIAELSCCRCASPSHQSLVRDGAPFQTTTRRRLPA